MFTNQTDNENKNAAKNDVLFLLWLYRAIAKEVIRSVVIWGNWHIYNNMTVTTLQREAVISRQKMQTLPHYDFIKFHSQLV